MSELAEFLLARIAEDEAHIKHPHYQTGGVAWLDYDEYPVLAIGEDRLERECRVKRRIVELHTRDHECTAEGDGYAGVFAADGSALAICPTMTALALPYADHPDYQQEWREEWRP